MMMTVTNAQTRLEYFLREIIIFEKCEVLVVSSERKKDPFWIGSGEDQIYFDR